MNPILAQILMALAQTALAGIGGYLVAHHIITASQADSLTKDLLGHVALALPLVAGLGLTLWNKYLGRRKLLVALQPGVHTEDQVNQILKSGAPTPTITTPSNTSPGVPKVAALLLLCVLGASAACHAPVTIVTPQGQTAYTADQIVVRVNELMNAAIAANASNALPTATTRTIVTFAVDADKVLASTPAGWPATLAVSWAAAKAQIGAVNNPAIVAAMSAVDVVIGAIQ